MERMRQLQESLLRDEGASQEEMESRFELEKSESLLVTPSGIGSQASQVQGLPLLTPSLLGSRQLHAWQRLYFEGGHVSTTSSKRFRVWALGSDLGENGDLSAL